MLMNRDELSFILVDVQDKLVGAIHHHKKVVDNCHWLMQLADDLSIPLLISEQYPQGLGETTQPLSNFKRHHKVADKTAFSCAADAGCLAVIEKFKRKQVLLMGIEAHVCVLQTAFELKENNFDVFVAVDAIGSRCEEDYKVALKRFRQNGIELVTREMVFFECLRNAKDPNFKELSKKFMMGKKDNPSIKDE